LAFKRGPWYGGGMVRCFVAVDVRLQGDGLEAYRRVTRSLESVLRMKPVEEGNLHLTLRFIGEVEEERVARIRDALRAVRHPPFDISLRGLGAFPSPSNPRVIWIGVEEGSRELRELRDGIESALRGIVPEDEEGFTAHLTIARVKGGGRGGAGLGILKEHGDADFGTMRVSDFRLKRSVLTRTGPIYTDIEVYRLVEPEGGGGNPEGKGQAQALSRGEARGR
ncbi:MAG: RNA 2',3'-cyclic phosphodiesterase, partial [Nitrososphaeria archaeon]